MRKRLSNARLKRRICGVPGYLLDTGAWVALAFANHPGHALARTAITRVEEAPGLSMR